MRVGTGRAEGAGGQEMLIGIGSERKYALRPFAGAPSNFPSFLHPFHLSSSIPPPSFLSADRHFQLLAKSFHAFLSDTWGKEMGFHALALLTASLN